MGISVSEKENGADNPRKRGLPARFCWWRVDAAPFGLCVIWFNCERCISALRANVKRILRECLELHVARALVRKLVVAVIAPIGQVNENRLPTQRSRYAARCPAARERIQNYAGPYFLCAAFAGGLPADGFMRSDISSRCGRYPLPRGAALRARAMRRRSGQNAPPRQFFGERGEMRARVWLRRKRPDVAQIARA